MRSRLATAITLIVLLTTACSDDGLCDRLPGTGFQSEEAISVVETADGTTQPSFEQLDFTDDEVWWFYSDVVELGEWECAGDEVTLFDTFTAELTEEDGRLVLVFDGNRFLD